MTYFSMILYIRIKEKPQSKLFNESCFKLTHGEARKKENKEGNEKKKNTMHA